jgi:hypothetical protein
MILLEMINNLIASIENHYQTSTLRENQSDTISLIYFFSK